MNRHLAQRLENVINDHLNGVTGDLQAIQKGAKDTAQGEAAGLIAGLIVAMKITAMQAGVMINEMELDTAEVDGN